MKKLLILLISIVFSINVNAQSRKEITLLYVPYEISDMTIIPIGGLDINIGGDGIEPITVQNLIDYQQYCYRDSTRVRRHKKYFRGKCYDFGGECENPSHYEFVWLPKEEPTFSGFIVWIRKKHGL